MKKLFSIVLFCSFSIVLIGQTDSDAVRKSFENYKTAVLNDKGKQALELVNNKTLEYYNELSEKVKTADSSEINSMSIIDKLSLLTMKHRISKSELLSFSGKDLFIYAIDNGMIGKTSVMNAELGDISVNGEFATAIFINNGQVTPLTFHFNKENGNWKFDLTKLFSFGSAGFKKVIEQSGKSENEFIIQTLTFLTGKKPSINIWKPLQ